VNTDHIEVVRLGPGDWRELKAIRLEGLRCEPMAFSSTYADSVARPDDDWRQRLANPASVTFVARIGTRPVGMVGAIFGADGERHVAMVFGMYVSATYRGQGVGRALMRTLLDHVATRPQIITLRLWVTPTQQAALRLYASLGFRVVENPDRSMLEGEGTQEEVAMERLARGRNA
jgi:ribosomal protein S18 acetylase RimI-like enzyme